MAIPASAKPGSGLRQALRDYANPLAHLPAACPSTGFGVVNILMNIIHSYQLASLTDQRHPLEYAGRRHRGNHQRGAALPLPRKAGHGSSQSDLQTSRIEEAAEARHQGTHSLAGGLIHIARLVYARRGCRRGDRGNGQRTYQNHLPQSPHRNGKTHGGDEKV